MDCETDTDLQYESQKNKAKWCLVWSGGGSTPDFPLSAQVQDKSTTNTDVGVTNKF